MSFSLEDFDQKESDGAVTLVHRGSREVLKFSAWDSRVLPYIEGSKNDVEVMERAKRSGVTLPLDHIRVIIDRLERAGMTPAVVPERSAPPVEYEHIPEPPRRPAAAPAPAPTPAPVAPSNEAPAIVDDERGRENLRREMRRMNKPLEYAPLIPVVGAKPASKAPPPPPPRAPQPVPEDDAPPPPRPKLAQPEALPAPRPAAPRPLSSAFEGSSSATQLDATRPAVSAPAQPEVAFHVRNRRGLLRTGIFVALVVAALLIPLPATNAASCRIAPLELAELRAPVAAVVKSVGGAVGQQVTPETVLVTLDSPDLSKEIAALEEDVADGQLELEHLQSGDRPDVKRQEAIIDERSTAAKAAIAEFTQAQQQQAMGKLSSVKLMEVEVRLSAAKRSLVDAQTKLLDLKSLDLPTAIAGRSQTLERAKTALAEKKQRLLSLAVKPPRAGTVVALPAADLVGVKVQENDVLAEVGDVKQMRILLRIPEEDLQYISATHPMDLKLGHGETLSVKLSRLSYTGEVDKVYGRMYRVEAVVDNSAQRLGNGMVGTLYVPSGYKMLAARLYDSFRE